MFTALNLTDFPEPFRSAPCWVVWRLEPVEGRLKPAKMPYQPAFPTSKASSTNPAHWSTLELALAVLEASSGFSGLMVALSPALGVTGIDLDTVVDGERIDPDALRWVHLIDSYTERSPSGRGLHILVGSRWVGTRNKISAEFDLEVYTRERFLTVTGVRLSLTSPRVESRPGELLLLERRFFPPPPPVIPLKPFETSALPLSDGELIERAYRSKGGAQFKLLMDGDALSAGFTRGDGTADHSSADLALCLRLFFWTGGDLTRTDALFRASGLYRQKWDSRRGRGTYGSQTLELAARTSSGVYRGSAVR